MRLIQQGTVPANRTIRFICRKCNCIFEASERECDVQDMGDSRDPMDVHRLEGTWRAKIMCPMKGCGTTATARYSRYDDESSS